MAQNTEKPTNKNEKKKQTGKIPKLNKLDMTKAPIENKVEENKTEGKKIEEKPKRLGIFFEFVIRNNLNF